MPNLSNERLDASGTDDEPHDGRETVPSDDGSGKEVLLCGTGIEKTYGSPLPFTPTTAVLTGADIEVREAEIVGIVGENGSGKSTLMQILVGALDADAGSVERPDAIGWCPQETLLYERLTVRETFDLFGEAYGMTDAEVAEARDRLAERLDFERFLDRRVDRLSGGNRQKVNLSVALLHDPDVLLLDEPYTGFDWETYQAFWSMTEELTERGTSVAIISHLINEHERFDRVYELRDGELVVQRGDDGGGDGAPGDATTAAPTDAEVADADVPDEEVADGG